MKWLLYPVSYYLLRQTIVGKMLILLEAIVLVSILTYYSTWALYGYPEIILAGIKITYMMLVITGLSSSVLVQFYCIMSDYNSQDISHKILISIYIVFASYMSTFLCLAIIEKFLKSSPNPAL